MTKAEYRRYKFDWQAALETGRVLVLSPSTMRAYPTAHLAQAALYAVQADGNTYAFISTVCSVVKIDPTPAVQS